MTTNGQAELTGTVDDAKATSERMPLSTDSKSPAAMVLKLEK